MSIVSCPRCRDEVSVPAKASPSALVRCPLCREQYRLEEALDQLPPALIVVEGGGYDDDEGELVGAGVGDYHVAGEVGDDDFGRGMMSDRVFSTSGPGGTAVADRAATAPTPRITPTARPKKKEKSAVLEILKVVVGGLVGIVGALVILWWAFGRDPLDLGPTVSQYAPWVVPTQFRGKNGTAKPVANNSADTSGGTKVAANPNNNSTNNNTPSANVVPGNNLNGAGGVGRRPDSELPPTTDPLAGDDSMPSDPLTDPASATIDDASLGQFKPEIALPGNNDPLNSIDTPPDLGPAVDPLMPADPTTTLDPPATNPATDPLTTDPSPTDPSPIDPAATVPTTPDPFATPPATTDPAPPTTDPASDPAAVAPAQVEEAISAAATAREAFDNSKGQAREVRQQLATEMYAAAADLGPLLTNVAKDDANFAATLEKANTELTTLADPAKRNTLAFLATKRLDTPDEGPGALIVGAVKDIKSAGTMFETSIEMPGKEPRTVIVVSSVDPQETFKVGDQAAVVGRIVRDAKTELPDYGGDQPIVVEQGHAVVLAAP
jgi:hypothetical protein